MPPVNTYRGKQPVPEASAVALGSTPYSAPSITRHPADIVPHLLVIDDDPSICEQLQRLFNSDGHKVSTVQSAERALQLLEKEDIDLVITDIQLPGLSGVELTRRM